jgi:pimeloyl-ACP methyl ester carboxylesterase
LYAVLGSTVTENCPDCDVAVKFRPSLARLSKRSRFGNWTGFSTARDWDSRRWFVAGDKDAAIEFYAEAYQTLEINAPNLAKKALLPGAGHWVQQERPAEVNRLLIEFLRSV